MTDFVVENHSWILTWFFVSYSELMKYDKVRDALPIYKGRVPIFIFIAAGLQRLTIILFVISSLIHNGLIATIATLALAWVAQFIISGKIIPVLTKNADWLPLTIGSIAFWPLALYVGYQSILHLVNA